MKHLNTKEKILYLNSLYINKYVIMACHFGSCYEKI